MLCMWVVHVGQVLSLAGMAAQGASSWHMADFPTGCGGTRAAGWQAGWAKRGQAASLAANLSGLLPGKYNVDEKATTNLECHPASCS